MSVLKEPSSLVPSVMQVQAKDKEKHHVQTKRIYLNRAFGGDFHYCVIDGDIAAYAPAGQKTG
jgi:hypothetical protein